MKALQTFAQLPRPAADLFKANEPCFQPVLALGAWAHDTFLSAESPLVNIDHAHLVDAYIGFVFAAGVENRRAGQRILGTAQLGQPSGTPWPRGRQEQQLREWFGRIPDFLITIDAAYFAECSEAEACALVEHELYHCAQAVDRLGEPKFDNDGNPVWSMRGHDIEEFAGVIRRYGASATHAEEIRAAFAQEPEISRVAIRAACGVCLRVA